MNQRNAEIWKDVIGYEGIYKISNFGKIITNRRCNQYGEFASPWREMKPTPIKSGYYYVSLCRKNIRKGISIHRLVAIAFINNPSNAREVNHIDANKANNRASNLEWVTHKDNQKHAFLLGLIKPPKKLTLEDALKIRSLYPQYNQYQIARMFNISQTQVSNIIKRKCWKEGRVFTPITVELNGQLCLATGK